MLFHTDLIFLVLRMIVLTKINMTITGCARQNDVGRIRAPNTLEHHMSLPSSTAEWDKLLQFQDFVPLRSRAKRGCATHPRSIAERVKNLAKLLIFTTQCIHFPARKLLLCQKIDQDNSFPMLSGKTDQNK